MGVLAALHVPLGTTKFRRDSQVALGKAVGKGLELVRCPSHSPRPSDLVRNQHYVCESSGNSDKQACNLQDPH